MFIDKIVNCIKYLIIFWLFALSFCPYCRFFAFLRFFTGGTGSTGGTFSFGGLPLFFLLAVEDEAEAVDVVADDESDKILKFGNISWVWWIYSALVKAWPALSFLHLGPLLALLSIGKSNAKKKFFFVTK